MAAAVNVLNTTSKYLCFIYFNFVLFKNSVQFLLGCPDVISILVLSGRLRTVQILTSALLKNFWPRRRLLWRSSGFDL